MKVVCVGVLKPANDVRLFRKIGATFAESGFEVHSIGFRTNDAWISQQKLFLYPVFTFRRNSFKRLLAGMRLLQYLWKIKPQIVLCGAIEVLPFCVIYKLFCKLFQKKVQLIYDVQENYFLNILYTNTYRNKLLKVLLAYAVSLVQRLCSWAVDKFFLAEQCYLVEIGFPKKKCLVLENKALPPQNSLSASSYDYTFLFAGTVAVEYGVWEAIDFVEKIRGVYPKVTLKIVGKCSNKLLAEKLLDLQIHKPFLHIKISENPIDYELMEKYFMESTFWLMPYKLNRAYQNRIPTKFYEAMAWNKWIIVQKNPVWQDFFRKYAYPMVVEVDFTQLDTWKGLTFPSFEKTISYNNPNIFWEIEKKKLQAYIEKELKLVLSQQI